MHAQTKLERERINGIIHDFCRGGFMVGKGCASCVLSQCIGCAFEHQFCTANMSVDIAKPALDLITRQKTEIERLKGLSKHHQILINELNNGIAEATAEAIKECLNKVAVFCAESGLFQCEADEMLLFNYLDSLKMKAMLKANGMVGDAE